MRARNDSPSSSLEGATGISAGSSRARHSLSVWPRQPEVSVFPRGATLRFTFVAAGFSPWRTTRGRADQAGCAGGQSPPGSERSHKSPGRKSGDTGSLSSPGSAWHAGRRSRPITAGTAEVSSQWLFRHHALWSRIPQPGAKNPKAPRASADPGSAGSERSHQSPRREPGDMGRAAGNPIAYAPGLNVTRKHP